VKVLGLPEGGPTRSTALAPAELVGRGGKRLETNPSLGRRLAVRRHPSAGLLRRPSAGRPSKERLEDDSLVGTSPVSTRWFVSVVANTSIGPGTNQVRLGNLPVLSPIGPAPMMESTDPHAKGTVISARRANADRKDGRGSLHARSDRARRGSGVRDRRPAAGARHRSSPGNRSSQQVRSWGRVSSSCRAGQGQIPPSRQGADQSGVSRRGASSSEDDQPRCALRLACAAFGVLIGTPPS